MIANTISLFNVYFSHKLCSRKHLNLKKGDEPSLWHFCPNFSCKNNSHEVLSAYIKMKELRLRTHSPKEMGAFCHQHVLIRRARSQCPQGPGVHSEAISGDFQLRPGTFNAPAQVSLHILDIDSLESEMGQNRVVVKYTSSEIRQRWI